MRSWFRGEDRRCRGGGVGGLWWWWSEGGGCRRVRG